MRTEPLRVLITSVGRRGYLVDYFRRAAGFVMAADCDPYAPGLAVADESAVLTPAGDPQYLPDLLRLCRDYAIDLVIPLNDYEQPVLAGARRTFAANGITVLVSEPLVVERCLDKWQTHLMLSEGGFEVPKTYLGSADSLRALQSREVSLPILVKPRHGSGSEGHRVIWDIAELDSIDEAAVIFQEVLRGEEFGLDVVNDLRTDHVATLVREKVASRFGETAVARTSNDPELTQLGAGLAKVVGHVGTADVDLFRTEDGRVVILEVNPRFGGGYPLSHAAGADVPRAIVAMVAGKAIDPRWLRVPSGVVVSKTVGVQVVTSATSA